jgi:hypothetical protein
MQIRGIAGQSLYLCASSTHTSRRWVSLPRNETITKFPDDSFTNCWSKYCQSIDNLYKAIIKSVAGTAAWHGSYLPPVNDFSIENCYLQMDVPYGCNWELPMRRQPSLRTDSFLALRRLKVCTASNCNNSAGWRPHRPSQRCETLRLSSKKRLDDVGQDNLALVSLQQHQLGYCTCQLEIVTSLQLSVSLPFRLFISIWEPLVADHEANLHMDCIVTSW